jgi:hypothetical protein
MYRHKVPCWKIVAKISRNEDDLIQNKSNIKELRFK